MFLAKLTAKGKLKQYPYGVSDLKRDNPNTSFPKVVTQEIAEAFGCAVVTLATPPAADHTKNVSCTVVSVDGTWTEQYTETDASADEIAERTAAASSDVRSQRNDKLKACDWTQMADSPLASDKKTEWATYRQGLRDISSASGFPHTMTWPTEPS
tara:strand:+ start:1055 stop:1519 length:465 start_codon:yes stop_codon:yes gene_type:complete